MTSAGVIAIEPTVCIRSCQSQHFTVRSIVHRAATLGAKSRMVRIDPEGVAIDGVETGFKSESVSGPIQGGLIASSGVRRVRLQTSYVSEGGYGRSGTAQVAGGYSASAAAKKNAT